jgi:acyl carrier protein
MSANATVMARARELAADLATRAEVDVSAMPAGLETPLRSLEIDSLLFVDFLVATEELYDFEWDEDTPPEAFETVVTMARTMVMASSGAGARGVR